MTPLVCDAYIRFAKETYPNPSHQSHIGQDRIAAIGDVSYTKG